METESRGADQFTCPPILFLVFNRPELTQRSLAAIRAAQPSHLYVAADGPRPDNSTDQGLCDQTRKLIDDGVDWRCKVHTLYRRANLGCERAVSSAVAWFFEHVESGIVLEDDCVPTPRFFNFCDTLLGRYSSDERVMAIAGSSFQTTHAPSESYFFSRYPMPWGWATWRRAWQHYSHEIRLPSGINIDDVISRYPTSRHERQYWHRIHEELTTNRLNTWDFRWFFSVWIHGGLIATPFQNLVTNIGYGPNATHTTTGSPANGAATSTTHKILHPESVRQDVRADRVTAQRAMGIRRSKFQRTVSGIIDYGFSALRSIHHH